MKLYRRGDHFHLDVTVHGVRYRETLKTVLKGEATELAQKRIADLQNGKGASKMGRQFARLPFGAAADAYLEERKSRVSEGTYRVEAERLGPLRKYFQKTPVFRITALDVSKYQQSRRQSGQSKPVAGRTVNMEIGVLRRIMKRGKCWNAVAEDVTMEREGSAPIAKVLTPEEKAHLFTIAGTRDGWLVAHCAAVIAAATTCRGVEIKHLRWQDVDLFDRVMHVRRSKTAAGHRLIPLNADAISAFSTLRERSEKHGTVAADHFVFPACESLIIDPTKPQKSWRTAWRALVRDAGRTAGRSAARVALEAGTGLRAARMAYRRAEEAFRGLRFHDLRHQAITELAEVGVSDATLMAVAGHLSRRMLEHYSHVRTAAKRDALDKLSSGLMRRSQPVTEEPAQMVQ